MALITSDLPRDFLHELVCADCVSPGWRTAHSLEKALKLLAGIKKRQEEEVRDLTTWTILQKDGPNHHVLRHNVLPPHQMALITSGCVPFRRTPGARRRPRS